MFSISFDEITGISLLAIGIISPRIKKLTEELRKLIAGIVIIITILVLVTLFYPIISTSTNGFFTNSMLSFVQVCSITSLFIFVITGWLHDG